MNTLFGTALLALLLGAPLAAPVPAGSCDQQEAALPSGKVDGPTAKRLVAAGARLVDVRAPEFYAASHLPGAINIPVAQIAARAAAEIGPVTTKVVLYCRTGAGSAKAAATLTALGYTFVYDLGSFQNWPAEPVL